jgi:hypothetical protein
LSFASQRLAQLPLFIDDTPGLTIAGLRARARRLKRRHDIGLVIVDYLQLLSGTGKAGDNRVNEISEISRGLKQLAKELHVPVIALSQLSRAVEQREDKRPCSPTFVNRARSSRTPIWCGSSSARITTTRRASPRSPPPPIRPPCTNSTCNGQWKWSG